MSSTVKSVTEGNSHSSIASRSAGAAHDAVSAVGARLSSTEGKLRDVASETSQRLMDSQKKAKKQMKKSLHNMQLVTRKNPLIVAGAAFAIGAVAALLLRRK